MCPWAAFGLRTCPATHQATSPHPNAKRGAKAGQTGEDRCPVKASILPSEDLRIAVVGLGYAGLWLALQRDIGWIPSAPIEVAVKRRAQYYRGGGSA